MVESQSLPVFRTSVRERKIAMLAVLLIVAASYGAWRIARAIDSALRASPRSNEDMIFY